MEDRGLGLGHGLVLGEIDPLRGRIGSILVAIRGACLREACSGAHLHVASPLREWVAAPTCSLLGFPLDVAMISEDGIALIGITRIQTRADRRAGIHPSV
jgi:hypothetical protein